MKRFWTIRQASLSAALVLAVTLAGGAALRAMAGAESVSSSANQNPQETTVAALAASANSTELTSGPVSVTLASPAGQPGAKLGARISSLGSNERIYLVMKGMSAQQQPGVLYHIYLDLPTGVSAPANNDPHFVGVLNFYNARAEASPIVFRSFDVTDLVRNLQKQNLLSDQTTVTIIPSHGGALNADAKPVIGRIELVVQANPS